MKDVCLIVGTLSSPRGPGNIDPLTNSSTITSCAMNFEHNCGPPVNNNFSAEMKIKNDDISIKDLSSNPELDLSIIASEQRLSNSCHNSDRSRPSEEAPKLGHDLKDNKKVREYDLKLIECAQRRRKLRTKGARRGESLEREISELISNEDLQEPDFNFNENHDRILTTTDILSDLIESCVGTSCHCSESRESTTNVQSEELNFFRKHAQSTEISNDKNLEQSTIVGHLKNKDLVMLDSRGSFDCKIFDFSNASDEWAAFDNCSAFDFPFEESEELDDNGFPLTCGNDNDEAQKSYLNFELISTKESYLSEPPLKLDKKEVGKKISVKQTNVRESLFFISCDDKSTRLKPSTSNLARNSTKNSCSFELTRSASSITNVAQLEGSNDHMTTAPYLVKSESSTCLIETPVLTWNPTQPKHYNNSRCIL